MNVLNPKSKHTFNLISILKYTHFSQILEIFTLVSLSYCEKMRKYRYLCTSLQRRYLTEIESDK